MVTPQECIFCKVARGEVPSWKIYDDKEVMAFLDINPAVPGHTLVVPKKHIANIYDADSYTIESIMKVVKMVAEKLKTKMNAEGVNVLQNNGRQAGQIVDHIHFHVIPRQPNDSLVIHFPRAQINEQQMKEIQDKLKEEPKKQDYGMGNFGGF